jgi:hypothetical protein
MESNRQQAKASKSGDSRKAAKAAKDKKFEARNPKFETSSNDQNMLNSKQVSFGFGVFGFSGFEICCFGFRYSDFGFLFRGSLGAIIFLSRQFGANNSDKTSECENQK